MFAFFFVVAALYAYTDMSGGVCQCDSCSDCTNALNDETSCYNEVILTVSIADYSGNCIDNPANFTEKIFNCTGNTIDGDDSAGTSGIRLMGAFTVVNHSTAIQNCYITDFEKGIWIHQSANNTLENNIVESNAYGVYLSYAPNNNLFFTTASYNTLRGIELDVSSGNYVGASTVFGNLDDGIALISGSGNTFEYNEVYDNGDDGFYLSSSSNNNEFTSNEAYNNGANTASI